MPSWIEETDKNVWLFWFCICGRLRLRPTWKAYPSGVMNPSPKDVSDAASTSMPASWIARYSRVAWPRLLTGNEGRVRVVLGVAAGIQSSIAAIRSADAQAVIVHVEAARLVEGSVDLAAEVQQEALRAFLPTDLVLGLVDREHPLTEWLLASGATMSELDRLRAVHPRIDGGATLSRRHRAHRARGAEDIAAVLPTHRLGVGNTGTVAAKLVKEAFVANFWSIRRGARPELVDGAAAVDLAPQLEPIQLFTLDGHVSGAIDSGGRRITDVLNAQPELRICVDGGSWTSVERKSLLLVAPPPHPGVRQRRVHRQKRRIRALSGPYEVLGTAHLIPGIPLDPFLLRSRQHFLPLTNAWLTRGDDPAFAQDLDVVLLNVGNVRELHALLTLA